MILELKESALQDKEAHQVKRKKKQQYDSPFKLAKRKRNSKASSIIKKQLFKTKQTTNKLKTLQNTPVNEGSKNKPNGPINGGLNDKQKKTVIDKNVDVHEPAHHYEDKDHKCNLSLRYFKGDDSNEHLPIRSDGRFFTCQLVLKVCMCFDIDVPL